MQGNVQVTIPDDDSSELSQKNETTNGLDFLQFSQLPLTQLGYPQAQAWIQHRKATLRPWSVFLNTSNFKTPPRAIRFVRRYMKNIEYFQSNYLCVFIGLVVYCLITSPLLLLAVAASLGACYKVSQRHAKQELTLFNRKMSLAEVYIVIGVCSLPLFYLVGAGPVLFWVLGVSWCIITLHSAFYNIDSILCQGENELNALMMQEV